MAIHSNRTQAQRQRALDGFKAGRFRVLVATDIAARGIDVDGISHVINYDIPHYAEDYIHRIGRTGRAGATGDAVTFVAGEDRQHLRKIEQFTGQKFHVNPYPGFTPEKKAPDDASGVGHHRLSLSGHRPAGERPSGQRHAGQRPVGQRPSGQRPTGQRPVGQRPGGRPSSPHPHAQPRHQQNTRRKGKVEFAQKRKPPRKLDSFSSDQAGPWSNH